MNELDMDPGLAGVIACLRQVHDPIYAAIDEGCTVSEYDYAALSGAVQGLLNAIDARLPQPSPQMAAALKAVA